VSDSDPGATRTPQPHSAWLGRVAVVGALIALVALVWLVTLPARIDDEFVERDGDEHLVEVEGSALVWTADWEATPDCTATDGSDGDRLSLEPVDDGASRAEGPVGDLVVTWRVEAPSGEVALTCSEPAYGSDPSPVLVTRAPVGPDALADPLVRSFVTGIALVLVLALGSVACVEISRTRASRRA
jgi:hypothetical protein